MIGYNFRSVYVRTNILFYILARKKFNNFFWCVCVGGGGGRVVGLNYHLPKRKKSTFFCVYLNHFGGFKTFSISIISFIFQNGFKKMSHLKTLVI